MPLLSSVALNALQLASPIYIKPKKRGIVDIRHGIPEPTNLIIKQSALNKPVATTAAAVAAQKASYVKKALPDILADAVIEERHEDSVEVTEHPIAYGAAITDHAYYKPAMLTLVLGWSNSSYENAAVHWANVALASAETVSAALGGSTLSKVVGAASTVFGIGQGVYNFFQPSDVDSVKDTYADLLYMMKQRLVFTVYTGKRKYQDMVCIGLSTTTDSRNENSMIITMNCKQLLVVDSTTIPLTKENQAAPEDTASLVSRGTQQAAQTFKYVEPSGLPSLTQVGTNVGVNYGGL